MNALCFGSTEPERGAVFIAILLLPRVYIAIDVRWLVHLHKVPLVPQIKSNQINHKFGYQKSKANISHSFNQATEYKLSSISFHYG